MSKSLSPWTIDRSPRWQQILEGLLVLSVSSLLSSFHNIWLGPSPYVVKVVVRLPALSRYTGGRLTSSQPFILRILLFYEEQWFIRRGKNGVCLMCIWEGSVDLKIDQ